MRFSITERLRATAVILRGLLLICLISVVSPLAWSDEPLAKISGDLPPDIEDLLREVIGRVEKAPRSSAQAQRRAVQAAKKAEDVMRSQGYYGANIQALITEHTSSDQVEAPIIYGATVEISPGDQFRYAGVNVVLHPPNDALLKDISREISLTPSDPAVAARVVSQELRLVKYLNTHGYPDAKARPRKAIVDHDSQSMTLTYDLETGRETRFGGIQKTGSAYLSKGWPGMIATFQPGDVFDVGKLNGLSARVLATGVFESATATLSDAALENGDGSVTRDVILKVEQGAINTISGELGYSTTDGSGITATYERRNYIGYAQTLTVTATIKTNQIGMGVDYNIPYAFRADREFDVGADISRENTDAFKGERLGGNALITQKISDRLKIGTGLGLEASQFEQNNQDVRAYVVELVGRGTYDSRNNILNPEKGVLIEGSAVPSYNFGVSDGVFTTLVAGASTYRRMSDTLIAAARIKGGTIVSDGFDTIPLNRRFYGGGGGSVRGVGYQSISPQNAAGESIGGRSIVEGSVELRYKGKSPFGFAAFLDGASVSRDSIPDLDDIRFGAGVGVRYHTSFAPLRLDVAVPLDKRPEDDAFQIYISIGQAF